jgi:hypothetical protein
MKSHIPDQARAQEGRTLRACRIGLLAAVLAGAILRAAPLADRPLWFDELGPWWEGIHKSYGEILRWRIEDPNHTPLAFLTAAVSMDLLRSDADWCVRLPSLIAGILCIPAAYLLGKAIFSERLGLLAAALVAFDPNLFDQSQQARMYTQFALLELAALTWTLVCLRDSRRGLPSWACLGVLLAAMVWTLQLAMAVWAASVFAALSAAYLERARTPPRRILGRLALALGIAVLLAAPGLRMMAGGLADEERQGKAELSTILQDILVEADHLVDSLHLSALVYPLAALGLLLLLRRERVAGILLVAVGLAGTLILIPIRSRHWFLSERYFTAMQPALWIGLSVLPLVSARARTRAAAGAAFCAFLCVQAWQCWNIEQWWHWGDRHQVMREIAAVGARRGGDDALVLGPDWLHPLASTRHGAAISTPIQMALRAAPGKPLGELLGEQRPPATWLVATLLERENRRRETLDGLRRIAGWYGLKIDDERIEAAMRADETLVVRIDARAVELRSVPPAD